MCIFRNKRVRKKEDIYMEKTAATGKSSNGALLKFLVFSVFGVFFFFINVSIGGVSKVPLIHLIDNAKAAL